MAGFWDYCSAWSCSVARLFQEYGAQPAGEPIPTIDSLETTDTGTLTRGDSSGEPTTVETQRTDQYADIKDIDTLLIVTVEIPTVFTVGTQLSPDTKTQPDTIYTIDTFVRPTHTFDTAIFTLITLVPPDTTPPDAILTFDTIVSIPSIFTFDAVSTDVPTILTVLPTFETAVTLDSLITVSTVSTVSTIETVATFQPLIATVSTGGGPSTVDTHRQQLNIQQQQLQQQQQFQFKPRPGN